jgi:hypothetical protein
MGYFHYHHLSGFSINNNLYILNFTVVMQRVIINRQRILSLIIASMNISEIGTGLLKITSSRTCSQRKTRSDRVTCTTTYEEMAQVLTEQQTTKYYAHSIFCEIMLLHFNKRFLWVSPYLLVQSWKHFWGVIWYKLIKVYWHPPTHKKKEGYRSRTRQKCHWMIKIVYTTKPQL